LEFTNVDINHAIREVLPLLRGELENGGVLLRVDLFAGDRPVLADPIQLQQVLINLIRNAVEVMMTIIDGPQVLRILAQTTEDEMRRLYQFEDTGPGLDPGIADRISEPLFTSKLDGMGLSICRSQNSLRITKQ
jgi:C4-dicarboxylate-specific signal transduction histidine kinase